MESDEEALRNCYNSLYKRRKRLVQGDVRFLVALIQAPGICDDVLLDIVSRFPVMTYKVLTNATCPIELLALVASGERFHPMERRIAEHGLASVDLFDILGEG